MERLALFCDFYPDTLAKLINKSALRVGLDVEATPHFPVIHSLRRLLRSEDDNYKSVVILQRLESVSPSFNRALSFESHDAAAVEAEVEAFCREILDLKTRVNEIFIITFCKPALRADFGFIDYKSGVGLSSLVQKANTTLTKTLADTAGIYFTEASDLESSRADVGSAPWYTSKQLFPIGALSDYAHKLTEFLSSIRGAARKLIVCDLDNTIWGGIVGDDGWENLRIGGHDPIGEAFLDVQHSLLEWKRRGILLAISSKNTEEVVREAFDQHPEMVLSFDDFVSWRINWSEKHLSVSEMCEALRINPRHTCFIDDNPVERQKMRDMHPDVYSVELPKNPLAYADCIRSLTCFNTATFTPEDRDRTELYKADERRRQTRISHEAVKQETGSSHIVFPSHVIAEPLSERNAARAHQLLNKTNQFNMRTRRMTLNELHTWCEAPGNHFFTYRVSDEFGDSGLTGIASYRTDGDLGVVEDFLMSCRIIGRGIEDAIIFHIASIAAQNGLKSILFEVLPSDRNAPCVEFLANSALDGSEPNVYLWDVSRLYTKPPEITLEEIST